MSLRKEVFLLFALLCLLTSCRGNGETSAQTVVSSPSLSLARHMTITTGAEGGSARPEIVATKDNVYVLYLANISGGNDRRFDVKIYDSAMTTVVTSTTIVSPTTDYGSPTDIRVASDGEYLYAFYETVTLSNTHLWGRKYALNDTFGLVASTTTPFASSPPESQLAEGGEILNDPAPLIGTDSVYVITRIRSSISTTGNTLYRVRELNKDTLTQIDQSDLDLSGIADGRGRVTSLTCANGSIYIALATTVSDVGVNEASDDGAFSDIILVRMNPDWTFDPLADVRTISAEPDDRENYITGLRADSNYFYVTYKQSVGSPPAGEHRAVIKIFDSSFHLLHKEVVRSVIWGPGGGEIRPSIEIRGNTLFSGQSAGQGLGTGNGEVYVFEMK